MLRAALAILLVVTSAVACGQARPVPVDQNAKKVDEERVPHKLVARGKAFAKIGDLTRAEQYLTTALEEGADPNEVLPLLMRVCIDSGRFREAITHGYAQLETQPHNAALRFLIGSLHQGVGEPHKAREQFQEVIAIQPDHAEAHYALAIIARDAEGDLVRADRHFREYLRLQPNGPHAEKARASLLKSVP